MSIIFHIFGTLYLKQTIQKKQTFSYLQFNIFIQHHINFIKYIKTQRNFIYIILF